MLRRITDDEFGDLLRSFRRTAFYFEAQETYALDYEAADMERFLAGSPQPPPEIGWWRPWLDQVAELTRQGKRISRVRVISEPPSDYQRWQLWSLPWHIRAGEQITYIARSTAIMDGLPLDCDWWLLDDERVIQMHYTADGRMDGKELVIESGVVELHRKWRDLAVRNAIPAEEIAAA
jgi:hypothetical protein